MNQKRNKGITLIALVITIIVLLILAGVTISMVLGDDGIITQAQDAGKRYDEKADIEAITLAVEAEDIRTLAIDEDRNGANIKKELEKTFEEGKVEITSRGVQNSFNVILGNDVHRTYIIKADGTISKRKIIEFTLGGDLPCDNNECISEIIKCEAYEDMTWAEWDNSNMLGADKCDYYDLGGGFERYIFLY